MAYVNFEEIIKCRKTVNDRLRKGDTFAGLMVFLITIDEWIIKDKYAKANMGKFSAIVDKAFYLGKDELSYQNKYWYAMFSKNWKEETLKSFLKDKKLPAYEFAVSLFWYKSFRSSKELVNYFKDQLTEKIFEKLFYIEDKEIQFENENPCPRDKLLEHFGGTNESRTIKYDGSFIKKRAGDLSGAPFSQTLYAAAEIKKIISVYDFNFIDIFDLKARKDINDEIKHIDFNGELKFITKPFLLLAGISGTGKTRFVRKQADKDLSNYQLVPVRPDWHEPSDLLGFVTRLTKKEQYVATDVLKFIVKAWRAILEAGLTFEGSTISGDISDIQKIRPYWLCLDEMNLAPVEQYFADYLSISETQQWKHEDGLLTYSCDSLLSSGLINSVDKDKLRDDLKLSDDDSEQLWQHFIRHGISIPFNLIVAGTVNMDETTHSFSRKVIDRALSFDFGEFYPNDFQKFFETDIENQKLTFPIWTDGRNLDALSQTFDGDGKKSISFLQSINKVLDDTPFKLAYRALNEILLSVITNKPQTENELCAVWDDFIMCKLLPRIEGDLDKLSSHKGNDSLLLDLLEVLEKKFEFIWEGKSRPDLYRKYTEEKEHPVDAPTEDSPSQVIWIPCRSKKKLVWMQDRLIRDTFTSFWP